MSKFEKIDLPWDINECMNAYEEFKRCNHKGLLDTLKASIAEKGGEETYNKHVGMVFEHEKELFRKTCQYMDYLVDNQLAYGTKEN
jgi:hypothetical protein